MDKQEVKRGMRMVRKELAEANVMLDVDLRRAYAAAERAQFAAFDVKAMIQSEIEKKSNAPSR